MQLAAAAALALALSLVLPWYQKSYFQSGKVVQANVSALGVFTFVEAAVLLVAVAVLFLVWARSQRRGFHLPGGDGVAITLAGGWAVLLLVWRLFDKPDIQGVGARRWASSGGSSARCWRAGALIVAGARVRAAHRPEPPNPAAEDVEWVERRRAASATTGPTAARANRPRSPSVLRERPGVGGRSARAAGRPARADDPPRPTSLARADHAAARRSLPRSAPPGSPTTAPRNARRGSSTIRSRAQTTRLGDERTTRLPEDPSEARTRRQRRPRDTPPLWEDEPAPSGAVQHASAIRP